MAEKYSRTSYKRKRNAENNQKGDSVRRRGLLLAVHR